MAKGTSLVVALRNDQNEVTGLVDEDGVPMDIGTGVGDGVKTVGVAGPIKNTGTDKAPVLTMDAATTAASGAMTGTQVTKLETAVADVTGLKTAVTTLDTKVAGLEPLPVATAGKLGGIKPSASVAVNATTGVASIPAEVLAAAGPIDSVETLAMPTNLVSPTIDMGDAVTLKGRMLRRTYIGNNDENSFSYNIDRPQVFAAENVNIPATLNNSNTAEVMVGELVIPGNLGNVSPTGIDATITLNANAPITAGRIALALGKYRTSEKYKIIKEWTTTQGNSVTMQVRLLPTHPSVVKLSQLAVDTAPTTYPKPSMKAELNTLGNVRLPIFFRFASPGVPSPATCTITSMTATATVTPAKKFQQVAGKTYRHASGFPYPSTDPINSPLLDTVSCTGIAFTHNPATVAGTVNATGTAGSKVLTLFSTAKLKVGMIPQIVGLTYRGTGTTDAECGYPANAFNVDASRQTFGYGCQIASVDSATQVTLNQPLLKDVSMVGKDQYSNINSITFFANAETVCIQGGYQSNSMDINPITGVRKRGSQNNNGNQKAVPYPNSFPFLNPTATDPLRTVTVGNVVAPNGWIFGVTDAQNNGGESFANTTFQIRIPAFFNSAYLNAFNNSDRNLVINMPDGLTKVELFYCTFTDATNTLYATRAVVTFGQQPSIPYILDRPEFLNFDNVYDGISFGTRAWGGGLSNGIVRFEEWLTIPETTTTVETDAVIDAKLDIAWNCIQHPVCMVLAGTQLKSNNFCPDPAVQATKVNYKSFISQFEKHTPAVAQGGTGYALGDVLYCMLGVWDVPARFMVAGISGGGATGPVTAVINTTTGMYRTIPTDAEAAAMTTSSNKAGTGCVLNLLSLLGDASVTTAAQAFPDSGRNSMWVFPGTTVDNGYLANYSGAVPMSAVFTLDSRMTMASLKAEWKWRRKFRVTEKLSSYEFFAVLAAIFKYGAPVMDLSEGTHNLVVVDDRVARSLNYSNLHGDTGGLNYPNLMELKTKLALVENVTVKGKGGVGTTPRTGSAYAPDLYPINN